MRAAAIALLLVLSACALDTADQPTMTSASEEPPTAAPPSTASTTMRVVESTMPADASIEPVQMCGRGQRLEPGPSYIAECFIQPVALRVTELGWSASPAEETAVSVTYTDRSNGLSVGVALIAVNSEDSPEEVLDVIASKQGITALADPIISEVSGRPGLYFDVQGDPRGGGVQALDEPRPSRNCPPRRPVRYKDGGNTLIGQVGATDEIGVGYCHVARVWAVEVDGLTITIVGGTTDPERHEEAVAKVESLFEGLSFEVAGS